MMNSEFRVQYKGIAFGFRLSSKDFSIMAVWENAANYRQIAVNYRKILQK
jgi:hypothetical protein